MDDLELDTAQERYFHDLFVCCESEGKVPALRATELFRSANLSNQVITQITLLAGVPQTALHLSKRQFYSCLKLISAYQASLPLREEIITSSMMALPLPKFNWKDSPPLDETSIAGKMASLAGLDRNGIIMENGKGSSSSNNRQWIEVRSPDLIELAGGGKGNDADGSSREEIATSDLQSTDSEVEVGESGAHGGSRRARKGAGGGSPEAWSTASDSPTPTNSVVADRPWAKGAMWLCEEQRQLLGTEEESSDRHSSDDDHDIDLESVYQISPEQKEYYIKQFHTVQPDINGLLSGHRAKVFFEKSRIPVDELRHIWQLCDVTRDGALSLNEFIAAMHLVVLRRNNIPIPTVLPPNLAETLQLVHPKQKLEAAEADLLHLESDDNNEDDAVDGKGRSKKVDSSYTRIISLPETSRKDISPPPIPSKATTSRPESSSSPVNAPASPDSASKVNAVATKTKKEWTKFPESPTISSNLSSPGPKPVNFDLQRTTQAVVSDPQILHPVPLRVTPEVVDEDLHRRKTTESGLVYEAGVIIRENTSPKVLQTSHSRDSSDIRPIQRPQPKKMSSKGAIPPPPQREPSLTTADSIDGTTSSSATIPPTNSSSIGPNNSFTVNTNKKDPPPLPPPRPNRHHRSSSLDLKKLNLGNENNSKEENGQTNTGPHLQPMASYDGYMESGGGNSAEFANFAHFPDGTNKASGDSNKIPPQPFPRSSLTNSLIGNRSSAFEVYRKPNNQTASSSLSRNSQSPHEMQALTTGITNNNNGATGMDYEKRIIAISDNLRLVRIKPGETMVDVLKHLNEQNHLLLRLCNDLSEELLGVQCKREEIRLKLEALTPLNNVATGVTSATSVTTSEIKQANI